MTMKFRTLKDSIVSILGAAASSRFQVIGYQRQAKDASEVLDASRMVQVYYKSGEFSKSGGRVHGSTQHDITFQIDLTVAKGAVGDVSTMNNESATPSELQAALAAFQDAADLADDSIDELFDIVYQILMNAENYDLGLSEGLVANRWIDTLQKDNPVPRGEYVILTGAARMTCRVSEDIDGESLVTVDGYYDNTIDIDGDDTEKTGVSVDNSI